MAREDASRLLLVDGNNLFFRAYFGLSNSDKFEPIYAVTGFFNALGDAVRRFQPSHMVVVFDDGRSTWRMQLYPEYKQNRPKQEEQAMGDAQLYIAQDLLDAMGISIWLEAGVEGDDHVAAVIERIRNLPVLILSGDKDLRQLVRRNEVNIFHPGTSRPLSYPDIEKMYGLPPHRLPELWALHGDKTDNIPGVPSIGEKRAKAILSQWGDVGSAVLHEPRLAGHDYEVSRNLRLVTVNPALSKFSLDTPDLVFNPVGYGQGGAEVVEMLLDRPGLGKLNDQWIGGTLWRDRGRRPRDFSKRP